MDITRLASYRLHSSPSEIEGEVAGIALPFETSDGLPGMWFDEGDGGFDVTFFNYTLYAPDAFREQAGLPDWGGRVQFMWEHGLHSGMTTIPIGNVTSLRATPNDITFRAHLNETRVADDMRAALAADSVKETSTKVELLAFDFPTDDDGLVYRRVTEALLWDVSLVRHGQFPQARLIEVHCDGCGATVTDEGLRQHYQRQLGLESLPPHDERKPHGGETVTVPREAVGKLYARINDLQEELRLRA